MSDIKSQCQMPNVNVKCQILISEHCGMKWGDKKLYLPEDSILCLDGGRVPHGVYNKTDERRITFCLSLLEDSFDL